MSRHRLFRLALVAALCAALPAVPACSSDDTPAATNASIADVVREGDVTDGQLRAVLANEAQDWAWAGGSFHAPVDGGALPSDTPFEFSWKSDSTVDPPAAGATSDLQMVHLLVFGTASEPNLLRVFTTLDSFTPDARAWATLKTTGESEPVTLSLVSATLMGDQLVVDGGPFIGETLSFTVE
jgi:hypothetical protein